MTSYVQYAFRGRLLLWSSTAAHAGREWTDDDWGYQDLIAAGAFTGATLNLLAPQAIPAATGWGASKILEPVLTRVNPAYWYRYALSGGGTIGTAVGTGMFIGAIAVTPVVVHESQNEMAELGIKDSFAASASKDPSDVPMGVPVLSRPGLGMA